MIDFCNYQWTTAMEGGRIIHPNQPWMWYDEDCVFAGADAVLIAEHKPKTIQYWDGRTFHPTVACGLLRSADRFGYGRLSAEIQLPRGKNLWPAFWLVGEGEPWPKCGEIDICEAWTNQFGGYFKLGIPQPPFVIPSWDTTNNIHWGEDKDHHESTGSRRVSVFRSPKNPANNFIKYDVEWRPNTITFYVNGKSTRCYGWDVAQHLCDKKMRVIFDLWTTCEDFSCDTPMIVRNFEYKPIETL